MAYTDYPVTFLVSQEYQEVYNGNLIVDDFFITTLYKEIVSAHQLQAETLGFQKGNAPRSYIEENYKIPIYEHLQEFIFFHCLINGLYHELMGQKLVVVGDPLLRNISLKEKNASSPHFSFAFTRLEPEIRQTWKTMPFKPAQRKNYKDLDKQVENLVREEELLAKKQSDGSLHSGDWVCFSMALVNENHEPILGSYANRLWLKIGEESADTDAQELFLGKKKGDLFYSKSIFFQNYMSTQLDTHYLFLITVIDIVSSQHLSFELIKKFFRLRSMREMHQKLIEVFSFRNDISQRRETVENLFKSLTTNYRFFIPEQLIDLQQKKVVKEVFSNPDYHVYKAHADFTASTRKLAEKQLLQALIIDYIAYSQDIEVSEQDMNAYLHLMTRPRTKELIYFTLPDTKDHGQEQPIPLELLKRYCLREKTLNYLLYYLTKKS